MFDVAQTGFSHDYSFTQFMPDNGLSERKKSNIKTKTKYDNIKKTINIVQFYYQFLLFNERLLIHT